MPKKEQIVKVVRRDYPVIIMELLYNGYDAPEYFKDFSKEELYVRWAAIWCSNIYQYENEVDLQGKITLESWTDPEIFEKAKLELLKREKELLETKDKDFLTFCTAFERYSPAIIVAWAMENRLAKKVKEIITKHFASEEVEEIMNIINIPEKDNYFKQEMYDLVLTDNLLEHVKKYEWITSRYGKRLSYTLDNAQNNLSEINKEKYLENYNQEKENLRKILNLLKEKLTEEEYHFIKIMQFIVYYRTHRTDIMNKSIYQYIPKFEQLAKEREVTYQQLVNCTKKEILNQLPSKEEMDQRIKHYALILDERKLTLYSKKEEIEKIKDSLEPEIKQVNEFKGEIACKGKVVGKVKLIFDYNDFEKVNDKDILVTSMTTPNMIQIMKKAAAFVTEEGGITCHAAIISREMKTPCIIGTKIATKVLKDNDLIEVDANSGTIKILNSS